MIRASVEQSGAARSERRGGRVTAVQQRAWWAIAGIAIILVVFGATDVATGAKADPGISLAIVGMDPAALEAAQPDAYRMFDFVTRSAGIVLGMLGLLMLAVVAVPYRSGQPWAWRVLWLLPAWAILVPFVYLAVGTAADQPPAPPMISGPIVAVVAAAVLLVDRGRFRVSRPPSVDRTDPGA